VTEKTSKNRHTTMRRCHVCGSSLFDSIVHFGERGSLKWPLNWDGAGKAADKADVILCLGSSLKVLRRYPWLWCMDRPKSQRPDLYIVNLQWTPKDSAANLKLNGKCDAIMRQVMETLEYKVPDYCVENDPLLSYSTSLHSSEEHTCTKLPINAFNVSVKQEPPAEIKTENNGCGEDVKPPPPDLPGTPQERVKPEMPPQLNFHQATPAVDSVALGHDYCRLEEGGKSRLLVVGPPQPFVKSEIKKEDECEDPNLSVPEATTPTSTTPTPTPTASTGEYSLRRRPRKDYSKMVRPTFPSASSATSNGLVRNKASKVIDFKTIEWARDALYTTYTFGDKFEYMADIEERGEQPYFCDCCDPSKKRKRRRKRVSVSSSSEGEGGSGSEEEELASSAAVSENPSDDEGGPTNNNTDDENNGCGKSNGRTPVATESVSNGNGRRRRGRRRRGKGKKDVGAEGESSAKNSAQNSEDDEEDADSVCSKSTSATTATGSSSADTTSLSSVRNGTNGGAASTPTQTSSPSTAPGWFGKGRRAAKKHKM